MPPMNRNYFFPVTCILVLALLAGAPAIAAAVTCPYSCACLLPAEAKKMEYPGYCNGRQDVCGYDAQKNEKYCYEKPVTTAGIPQLTITAKPFATTTPATAVPQKCEAGCTCLSTADGKAKGLLYCGVRQTLCGYDVQKNPQYCFTLPAPVTPAAPAIVTGLHAVILQTTAVQAACPAGCSCLATDKADAAGFKRCSASTATCGNDPAGRQMFCYQPGKVSAVPPVQALPTSMLIPAVISTTQTPPPAAVRTVSKRDIAIAKLFGSTPPQSSTPSQRVLCNGSLVNTWTDPANCGSCGAFCAEGLVCSMGQCIGSRYPAARSACGIFQIQCNGTCSTYLYDEENCGRCGNRCGAPETCCNGHCTTADNDPKNCGGCGNRCGENATCTSGSCTCINGTIRCGTVCADTLTNEEHCGGCNIRCGAGEECCAGHCIDVTQNGMNCGTCNHNCGVGIYCRDSRCVDPETNEEHCGDANTPCAARQFCCNGVCINPLTNPGHCGSCDNRCYRDQLCIDGECINILTDENNCGSPGNYCSWETGGDTCCSGRCVFLTDDNNCGRCGLQCHGVTPYCMYDYCGGIGDILFVIIFGP